MGQMREVAVPIQPMASTPASQTVPVVDAQDVEVLPYGGMSQRRGSRLHDIVQQASLGAAGPTYCVIDPVAPGSTDGSSLAMIVRTSAGNPPEIVKMDKYRSRYSKDFNDGTGGAPLPEQLPRVWAYTTSERKYRWFSYWESGVPTNLWRAFNDHHQIPVNSTAEAVNLDRNMSLAGATAGFIGQSRKATDLFSVGPDVLYQRRCWQDFPLTIDDRLKPESPDPDDPGFINPAPPIGSDTAFGGWNTFGYRGGGYLFEPIANFSSNFAWNTRNRYVNNNNEPIPQYQELLDMMYILYAAFAAPSNTTTEVSWTTRDGTLIAGTDYTAQSGTTRFATGSTRAPNVLDPVVRVSPLTLTPMTYPENWSYIWNVPGPPSAEHIALQNNVAKFTATDTKKKGYYDVVLTTTTNGIFGTGTPYTSKIRNVFRLFFGNNTVSSQWTTNQIIALTETIETGVTIGPTETDTFKYVQPPSSPVTIGNPRPPVVCPFTFSPTARFHSIVPVGDALHFYSSKDRAIIRKNDMWFREGLLPPLSAGVLDSTGSGASQSGTWTAFWCYHDVRSNTFSNPSPESNAITIANGPQIRFTPPGGGTLPLRDTAFFDNGTSTPAATHWALFLKNSLLGEAYMVAIPPISSGSAYTVPITISTANIAVGRRSLPSNPSLVNSVAPSYGLAAYDGNRIWKTGAQNIKVARTLTLTLAGTTAVLSGGGSDTWTPSHIGREIVIDNRATGYFIKDIQSTTVADLLGPDGRTDWVYANATKTSTEWFLSANPNRVIASHYGSTGPGGVIEANYEGYPPTIYLEGELQPQDGNEINGIVSVNDGLIVTTPASIFRIGNSDQLNEVLPSVVTVAPVSRGNGLWAPNTLCKDESGIVYMLANNGPVRVIGNSVQQLLSGSNADLFPRRLVTSNIDIPTADVSTKDGILLIAGLQRLSDFGTTNLKNALALDLKNGGAVINLYPANISCVKFITPYNGQGFQGLLLFGDKRGYIGQFYVDFLSADDEIETTNWMYGSVLDPANSLVTARVLFSPVGNATGTVAQAYWLPRCDVDNNSEEAVMALEMQAKPRGADPFTFSPVATETITPVTGSPRVGLMHLSGQTIQYRLNWNSGTSNFRRVRCQFLNLLVIDQQGG